MQLKPASSNAVAINLVEIELRLQRTAARGCYAVVSKRWTTGGSWPIRVIEAFALPLPHCKAVAVRLVTAT